MKKTWAVSWRDRNGKWNDMGDFQAASSVMARNIAYNKVPGLGMPGDCETHRVKPGKTVYEYSNGALCVEAI